MERWDRPAAASHRAVDARATHSEELRMLQWLKDNGSDVSAVTVRTALAPCWSSLRGLPGGCC